MITAKEALELYNQSGTEVKLFLDKNVLDQVKLAAMSGKKNCFINCGSHIANKAPIPIHLYISVMQELQKLGYAVRFMNYGDSYVPRGMADDAGNGPLYVNYGISIGW